ncbi:MAG: enoyl-CoA hydratase/isomerase family protein [Acidimicrobiia bacterium]|nr:enoyl-CoA hydratase/isomerase family protein [Acidimicrobiia bacterium]MYE71763.1 enoyl-CoA hydratase/isomerase family protein [Acidimicrobiia bacterium]MYJ62436.1 enoyl-CoA hydratase/isomerase family protein [Acidimicrobiia bacterium]
MNPDDYGALEVSTVDRITTVEINRPEAYNAINSVLHDDFTRVFTDLDQDPDTDVVILTGAGKSFCAGGDIPWLRSMAGNVAEVERVIRADRRITESALTLEKPILAKVDGPAVGLGCSLALYCDFVYASERSVFGDPHVSVGLVAGDGGALLWPQLVGYARARRYLLTGDLIKAPEAADIGLITECVPGDELDATVQAMAERMRDGARLAIKFTKASINTGLRQVASAVVDRAASTEGLTMMTEDFVIALDAFMAKEPPEFIGR